MLYLNLYSVSECGLGVGDSGCGTRQTFTSTCGQIEVKDGPDTDTCEWNIIAPSGNIINVTFTHFSIEDTGLLILFFLSKLAAETWTT